MLWRRLLRSTNYITSRTKAIVATPSLKAPSHLDEAHVKQFQDIPGPISLPVIGSTWLVAKLKDPISLAKHMHETYGNISLFRNLMGVGDAVLILDVKDAENMFRNEGTSPHRKAFYSMEYYRNVIRKNVFGDVSGLLISNGEGWADLRSKINPILMQPRTATQYITSINNVADDFIERTAEFSQRNPSREMPSDYLDELHKWALESIGVIALDKRLGCIDKNPSEVSIKMAMYILDIFRMSHILDFSPMAPFCRKLNLPIWKRFVKCQDFFTNKVLELIDEAIAKVENDPNYSQRSETEKSVFEKLRTKGKILSVVMTLDMLFAGIDTTGKVSGAILYFLAVNKDAQNKVREELRRALPDSSNVITKDVLEQLPYLRAVIKETLRVCPPTTATLRFMTKDVVLGGYNIPKGKAVIIPHLYMSQSDAYYKNALEFKPERWLRSNSTATEFKTVSPFVSMPFGFGPRSCIGRRLALLELEIFTAKMVRNFDISWNYAPVKFGADLLYGIKDPLKLQLVPL